MREINITVQEEGQRLDRYLSKYFPDIPSGFLYKMLRKKNIKLNHGKAAGNEKLAAGDKLQIYFSEETMIKFGALPEKGGKSFEKTESAPFREKKKGLSKEQLRIRQEIRVLYQNEHILILHKPAGLLTQKADLRDDSLNDFLFDYWRMEIMKGRELPSSFRPSVANRLDRNTSGIVLCGITVKGLQTLTKLLKNRKIEKYYLCIVKGQVRENRKIYGYLRKDEKRNQVTMHENRVPGSVLIETWYEVLKSSSDASLLKIRLITGKSHQIRAHLASIGHPVLGDMKYGDQQMNRLLRKEGIHYQLLHSSELVLPQDNAGIPAGFSGLHIKDDVPEEFGRVMRKFGFGGLL